MPWLMCGGYMAALTLWKLTVQVKFASLHPMKLLVLLEKRINCINTINNYQFDFIINWSSKLLKGQISFFLKLDYGLVVNKQSTVVMIP